MHLPFDPSSSSLSRSGSALTLSEKRDRTRKAAVEAWAAAQLTHPETLLILDTETTGLLTTGFDEVVEVGVIDGTGNTVFQSLCQPQNLQREELGTHIHGITREELAQAPTFPAVLAPLLRVLQPARTILVYNLSYDKPMLISTAQRYDLKWPVLPWGKCVLQQYAEWHGQRDPRRGGFKWQSLDVACSTLQVPALSPEQRAHRAVGDALSTLGVLKALAAFHVPAEA